MSHPRSKTPTDDAFKTTPRSSWKNATEIYDTLRDNTSTRQYQESTLAIDEMLTRRTLKRARLASYMSFQEDPMLINTSQRVKDTQPYCVYKSSKDRLMGKPVTKQNIGP